MTRTAVTAAGFLVLGITVAGCGDDSSPGHHLTPKTGDRIPRISGLAFISPPTDSATDLPLAPMVRVAVVDSMGVPLAAWNKPVTISLSENAPGTILAGPHTVNLVEGSGEFEGLSLNVAGTYSLVASTPGLPPVTSRPFVISNHGWFAARKGLEGAGDGAVTVDPSSPNTLYFGGGGRYVSEGSGGVFTSTTGGQTWSVAGAELPDTAKVVGIDPASSAVYAFDKDAHAWRSQDGGSSWTLLNFGFPFLDIAVDPRTSGSVWAIATDRRTLYHTSDAGRTWSADNAKSDCSYLDVDPTDSTLICDGGLRRMTSDSAAWDVPSGLPSPYFAWFHHVDHAGNIYSAGGQCITWPCPGAAIYKLAKGSSTWRKLTARGWTNLDHYIGPIATSPSSPSTVYAVGWDGLYKSVDGGETFALTGNDYFSCSSLTIDPYDPNVVYAGVYGGPAKSTDGGRTFTRILTGLHNVRVDHFAVGAGAAPTIYAVASPWGLFRSTDGARTWSQSFTSVKAIATDPVHEGLAWVHSYDGSIQRTIDGGTTWHEVSAKGPDATVMLSDGTNLWAADAHAKVWQSTDGGKHWPVAGVDLPGNVNALLLDPADPKTLYAATTKGFAKSTNGGASWSVSGDCSPSIGTDQALLSMAISGTHLYMGGTEGRVYVSTDGGKTCERRLAFSAGKIRGLAVDSSDPSTVLAVTELRGIYRLTERGGDDGPSNVGLQGLKFNDVIAPAAWGLHTFFAASSVYGVFENSSGGR
ncbi:hypothetical protein LZC95_03505 [Pendulispora brunnea]|uniref:Uncharacterized protein n=1 Tax=Pendulispora brunnea TaxID=2905690 RepID=A0ABZ2KG69_9BACT